MAADWIRTSPPSWTTPVTPDYQPGPLEAEGGLHHLLYDEQTRETSRSSEVFRHQTFLIRTPEGTRGLDGLSIQFDPTWQKVQVHWVQVLREGVWQDRILRDNIRLLQREEELENGQINDRRTLHLLLEDLRPGDVLDWAYTVSGSHPAFTGHASGQLALDLTVPVDRFFIRLLWNRSDSLYTRYSRDSVPAQEHLLPVGKELVWDRRDVPAFVSEPDAPSWWEGYPWMDYSNYGSWSELVETTRKFYQNPPQNAELRAIADSIAKIAKTPAERIAAVLRFSQDGIRYLGYEGGLGSLVPRPPPMTLRNRQGDCKDKAWLMTTLLADLEIKSWPALTSSWRWTNVPDHLPSPWIFDHVIVAVQYQDSLFFYDPTDSYQRGPLEELPTAPWGMALVLKDGENTPRHIPSWDPEKPEIDVSEYWDASRGPDSAATLVRQSLYRYRSAESMRSSIASTRSEELRKSILDEMRSTYPDLELVDGPVFQDDSASGEFRMSTTYRSPGFWKYEGNAHLPRFHVYAPLLSDMLSTPQRTVGLHGPIYVAYPRHARVAIRAALPHSDWDTTSYTDSISLPAAEFRHQRTIAADTFRVDWLWHTTRWQVEPEQASEWSQGIDSARSDLEWILTLDERPWFSKINWPVLAALLSALFAGIFSALVAGMVITRLSSRPMVPPASYLPLIAYGTLLLQAVASVSAIVTVRRILAVTTWDNLLDSGLPAALASLVLLLGHTASLAWIVLPGWLLHKRHWTFPIVYTAILPSIGVLSFLLLALRGAGQTPSLVLAGTAFTVSLAGAIVALMAKPKHPGLP